jgi:hypothetical protein
MWQFPLFTVKINPTLYKMKVKAMRELVCKMTWSDALYINLVFDLVVTLKLDYYYYYYNDDEA